ncbi:MAG: hypothetical protein HS111_06395 [Kofleriaceae bacterium]|nr:hypothetical protein [Kofleriaceae bacterium]
MSNALMKSSGGGGSGIVPAVCSAILPGVGQLINGQTDKAIGVFAVWGIAPASASWAPSRWWAASRPWSAARPGSTASATRT